MSTKAQPNSLVVPFTCNSREQVFDCEDAEFLGQHLGVLKTLILTAPLEGPTRCSRPTHLRFFGTLRIYTSVTSYHTEKLCATPASLTVDAVAKAGYSYMFEYTNLKIRQGLTITAHGCLRQQLVNLPPCTTLTMSRSVV
jgi:hypothetical protein